MELIFVVTFLVFDASELDVTTSDGLASVPEERRLFFGALFGLLALTTQVLKVRAAGSERGVWVAPVSGGHLR